MWFWCDFFEKCGLYKLPLFLLLCTQVKLPDVFFFFSLPHHVLPEIAQVSITFSPSATLYSSLCFFLSQTAFSLWLLPHLPFSRESSVLQQKEEEKERLLFQCESDPTAIHRLPQLSKALQERRSHAVQDHQLTLSYSCITVEPAVGFCVSALYPLPLAQYLSTT